MIDMGGVQIQEFLGDKRWLQSMPPARNVLQNLVEKFRAESLSGFDRQGRRIDLNLLLHCPVLLYRLGEPLAIEAWVKEISPQEFYCISPEVFAPRDAVECELMIPAKSLELPHENRLILRCRAEVRRLIADRHISGYGIICRVLAATWDLRAGRERSSTGLEGRTRPSLPKLKAARAGATVR